eukprot:s3360_g9.t1
MRPWSVEKRSSLQLMVISVGLFAALRGGHRSCTFARVRAPVQAKPTHFVDRSPASLRGDYAFALKSLGRKQLCQEALWLLQCMMCYGPPPNVYHFNAAISACESSGYWEGVGTLLQQMTYFGVPPDVVQGS